eukprot:751648-Hanusia_phi.AAC.6
MTCPPAFHTLQACARGSAVYTCDPTAATQTSPHLASDCSLTPCSQVLWTSAVAVFKLVGVSDCRDRLSVLSLLCSCPCSATATSFLFVLLSFFPPPPPLLVSSPKLDAPGMQLDPPFSLSGVVECDRIQQDGEVKVQQDERSLTMAISSGLKNPEAAVQTAVSGRRVLLEGMSRAGSGRAKNGLGWIKGRRDEEKGRGKGKERDEEQRK